jgi:hypothetical protein
MDLISEALLNEFSAARELTGLPEDKRFEHFAIYLGVRRHFSETFDTEEVITGSGDDTSIDGIAILVNGSLVSDVDEFEEQYPAKGYIDAEFIFVQAERSSGFDTGKMIKFAEGVRDFFRESPTLRRNENVAAAADIKAAIYKRAARFKRGKPTCRLYYVTTGKWTNDQNLEAARTNAVEKLLETELFREVEFIPVDAARLQKLYKQSQNSIARDFNFTNKVTLPTLEGVTQAFLGILPVPEFIKLLADDDGAIASGLFYENVRDWQGLDNTVNGEIQNTLQSDHRDRFVLMNNGITIIARSLMPTGDRFHIEDYTIVNGCQTSHVLFENRERMDSSVMVPVRLIETTDESIITDIIRSTNRQTEVKAEQFFALGEFSKSLEMYCQSHSVLRRLYYERRSGQYARYDVEQTRIVLPANMIRAFASMFLEEPQRATRNYSGLKARVEKGEIFADGHRFEPYYTAAFALYRLEYLFRSGKIPAKFKPARYHILMSARILGNSDPIPPMNSAAMKRYCDTLLTKLWDAPKADELLLQAVEVISSVAESIGATDLNRDAIRTEGFTDGVRDMSKVLT